MRVSVVIPVHNRRVLVQEAIRSVLAQTYREFEIIVVDDGSDDGTADAIDAEFGQSVQLIRLPANIGRSAARNAGCAAARGDLIAFLDSDDRWLPEKLAHQVPLFADPAVAMAHARIQWIDAAGLPLTAETRQLDAAFDAADRRGYDYGGITETWCRVYTSTVVLRRHLLDETGRFDPALSVFEDWDLFWRVAREGRVVALADHLVQYRLHAGNTPLRWAADADAWLHVMRKHLDALPATDSSSSALRARFNLTINMALGEYWRGNRTDSRRWIRRAIALSWRPLWRPTHPVWGAPLLHAFLPACIADPLIALIGVDAYRTDRIPAEHAAP